jgi:hypothetical protein
MITREMICRSNSVHLSQVFTGFSLLHRAGVIALSQECRGEICYDATKPQHLRDAGQAHLLVVVNGRLKLYYDPHDSFEVDEDAAGDVDFYFKRSYAPRKLPARLKAKIYPLGLNYPLYTPEPDEFELQRIHAFERGLGARAAPGAGNVFWPTSENMEAPPPEGLPPNQRDEGALRGAARARVRR